MKTYFVFKDGKLVTVIQTKNDNVFNAQIKHLLIDYDYIVEDPQEVEKQIAEWKREQ